MKLNQNGQMLILAMIVLVLVLLNSVVLIGNALTFSQSSRYSSQDIQATDLAEAGIDKAIAALNSSAGSYNGESETNLGQGSYSVAISSIDANHKQITATGYLPNKTNPKVKRTIQIQVVKGAGVAFNYGVQVGQGGLEMENNARVNGSVYSNGNIIMTNGANITGDAYVAGGVQPTADQQSDCSPPNCQDLIFGQISNSQTDIAQSFKPTVTSVINKVSLKIKKVGNPADITVRLLADASGVPNKNSVLTSGTLFASLVTNQYGFIDVAFTSTPTLSTNSTYWIVIDSSANNSNYWKWSMDSAQGYTRGNALWSTDWQASNPVWNSISGDLGFQTYMGGVATYIQGSNTATIGGNAYANTLSNLSITGGAYYQVATEITAGSYHPNSTDPAQQVMPVSDANIQAWKDASSIATFTGNITGCQQNFPAGKYIGDISLSNNCIATMTDPIWITGNLSLDNNSIIKLNSSYGANSGVLVTDGTIKLSNNGQLRGSGTSGSYLLGISTYDSRSNGLTAIETDNGSSSSILNANNGIVYLHNNASLHEVTGWKLELDNGAVVTYDSGLASMSFSSGPSGNFSAIKGSYVTK